MRSHPPTLVALPLLALLAGCSHQHGPLSDTPDTTSLGVAGGLGPGGVSTAFGVYPAAADLKGVDITLSNRSTALAVRPAPLVPGFPGSPDVPRTSNAMQAWTTGPNLPVEASNLALEPEAPAAHAGASDHAG